MPILERGSYRIHYRLEGPDGAPLIVLSNALGAELGMWDGQAQVWAEQFRVLRYDNRGHGGSTAASGSEYTLAEIAGDACALIEHVGETAVHFCGLSMGGMVGMWLGVNRPEKIRKLVLANTAAVLGPKEIWDTRIAAVREGGVAAIAKGTMERWFTAGFREKSPEMVARIETGFLKTSVAGYTGCAAAIREMDQRAALGAIRAKTLVVTGTHDPSTPAALGQEIARAIRGARLKELAAAHLSNVEAEREFSEIAGQFLAERM